MVTLNNPDAVEYPVQVDLKIRGDIVDSVVFKDEDSELTKSVDLSASDLADGQVVNPFVNGDIRVDERITVEC